MTVPQSLEYGKKITYISLPLSLFKKKPSATAMYINVNDFIEIH